MGAEKFSDQPQAVSIEDVDIIVGIRDNEDGTFSNYNFSANVVAAFINANAALLANAAEQDANDYTDGQILLVSSASLMGEAVTSTNPGSHVAGRWWMAVTAGTYTNFGALTVTSGEWVAIVDNGTTYTKVVIPTLFSNVVDIVVTPSTNLFTGSFEGTSGSGNGRRYNPTTGASENLDNWVRTTKYDASPGVFCAAGYGGIFSIFAWDAGGALLGGGALSSTVSGSGRTWTNPAGTAKNSFNVSSSAQNVSTTFRVNAGTTPVAYEPPTPTTEYLVKAASLKNYYTKAQVDTLLLTIPTTWVTRGTSTLENELTRLDSTSLFKGYAIDAYLPKFLVAIVSASGLVLNEDTAELYVHYVWRAAPNGVGLTPTSAVAIGADVSGGAGGGTARLCGMLDANHVEPTPDAAGNIFEVLELTPLNSFSTRMFIIVNWKYATSGVKNDYSTSLLRPKSMLNYKAIRPFLASTFFKTNLPTTAVPHKVYCVVNDVSNQPQDLVRQDAQPIYLDHFLIGTKFQGTDVRFANGSDVVYLYGYKQGDNDTQTATPTTQTISTDIVIKGGANYNDRTVTVSKQSVKASAGADKLIKLLPVGDSTIAGLGASFGVPVNASGQRKFAYHGWAVAREIMDKRRIDFLYAQGYSTADIQTLNSAVISSTNLARHRFISLGSEGDDNQETSVNEYRGISWPYSLRANGHGGWQCNTLMNKPQQLTKSQGFWDALGLGNGTGTDYTGTAAQIYAIDRTAWGQNTLSGANDTAALRQWFVDTFAYANTGQPISDYNTKIAQIGANPNNEFYDHSKATTYTDTNGNVWTVRFSIDIWLTRYRTMTDAGVPLVWGVDTATIGTKITGANTGNYPLDKVYGCLPTHIVTQSCQNDGDVDHFGLMVKAWHDAIHAEYTAKGWGVVFTAHNIIDGAGGYIPALYPNMPTYYPSETMRNVHNNNLLRAQAAITNEDTNKTYVLPSMHSLPTMESVITRPVNNPLYALTGNPKHAFNQPNRSSPGIVGHVNWAGHRCYGAVLDGWIVWTRNLM